MKKVIVYGAGRHIRKLMELFSGLIDSVEVFSDADYSKTVYLDRTVIHPEDLNIPKYADLPVVIAVKNSRAQIQTQLTLESGVKPTRFMQLEEWIADALESGCATLVPKSVRLDICSVCQLDCAGCYMRRDRRQTIGSGMVRFEQFRQFADENPFLKSIEISNSGEPFLNPDLVSMIRYAREKDIDITVLNGTNFNDVSETALEALVKYQVKGITISLDGVSQEVYSRYRRNGSINRVISNIKKVNQLKETYHSPYPELIWQYILMNENEEEAEEAKTLAESLGMKMMYKLDSRGGLHLKDPARLFEITGIQGVYSSDYDRCQQDYNSAFCAQLIFSPQINWDGRLLGCCTVFQTDWNCNVFQEGFLACINRQQYRKTIAALLRGSKCDTRSPCTDCSVQKKNTGSVHHILL